MERTRLGLIGLLVTLIVVLSSVDLSLARIENVETSAQARDYFDSGTRLLKANQALQAIDPLRKAHAMDRADPRYALELGSALIQAGKFDEAQAMLSDLLDRTPNDGEANLLEAGLLVKQGDAAGATAYYHRAIYGSWRDQQGTKRIQARLELANLLANAGSNQELLAELLPLGAEAQNDLAVRRQVAHLFLVAGTPARAETAYRDLIRDDPGEKSNYAGLGEAALALGDYRGAEQAFQTAGASQQADLASEMAGLDPTVRRLSSAEKLRRSIQILQMARDAAARCQPPNEPLIESADRELSAKVRGAATNELAEERLALAEELWQQYKPSCGQSPSGAILAKLMPKLQQ